MFILRQSQASGEEEATKRPKAEASVDSNLNLSDFEDSWSPWSKCRKRCTQVRRRMCKSANSNCQSTILKEERPCTGGQCQSSVALARAQKGNKKSSRVKGTSTQKRGRRPERGSNRRRQFRVLYEMQRFIYSPWSDWEDCKLSFCRTLRQRYCMNPDICSNSIIQEVALCYTAGSDCERQYRPHVNETEVMINSEDASEVAVSVHSEQQQLPLQNSSSEEEITPFNEMSVGANGQSSTSAQAINDQNCGIRDPNVRSMLRIIGGRSARSRWPWMVAILNSHYQPYCGGTLIAPQYVITAGLFSFT